MRWLLVATMIAGCGVTDTADVATTVVEVHLTPACDDPNTCYETIDLWSMCGNDLPPIDASTTEVTATSSHEPDEIMGLVQMQYTGALFTGSDYGQLDFILTAEQPAGEVWGAYTDYDEPPLYKIDGEGHATEIDLTKLVGQTDSTLHFSYDGTLEDHTVKPPRKISVETEDPPPCCSAGRPIDLGVVFALVLIPWRRRRKLRA